MRILERFGMRMARRSRWLAQRLWLVAAVQVALLTRSHWRRLEPEERRRLIELARKSKGRPSNLTARERPEAAELLDKIDYAEYGGNVALTLLPFRPFRWMVEFGLGRQTRARRRAASRA